MGQKEATRSFKPLILLIIFLVVLLGSATIVLALNPGPPIALGATTPHTATAHESAGANMWKPENKLTGEALKTCFHDEVYLYSIKIWRCKSADAACWWRNAPYYNTKCWNVFHLKYYPPFPGSYDTSKPWLVCVRAAWASMAGRVTKRGSWECERKPWVDIARAGVPR